MTTHHREARAATHHHREAAAGSGRRRAQVEAWHRHPGVQAGSGRRGRGRGTTAGGRRHATRGVVTGWRWRDRRVHRLPIVVDQVRSRRHSPCERRVGLRGAVRPRRPATMAYTSLRSSVDAERRAGPAIRSVVWEPTIATGRRDGRARTPAPRSPGRRLRRGAMPSSISSSSGRTPSPVASRPPPSGLQTIGDDATLHALVERPVADRVEVRCRVLRLGRHERERRGARPVQRPGRGCGSTPRPRGSCPRRGAWRASRPPPRDGRTGRDGGSGRGRSRRRPTAQRGLARRPQVRRTESYGIGGRMPPLLASTMRSRRPGVGEHRTEDLLDLPNPVPPQSKPYTSAVSTRFMPASSAASMSVRAVATSSFVNRHVRRPGVRPRRGSPAHAGSRRRGLRTWSSGVRVSPSPHRRACPHEVPLQREEHDQRDERLDERGRRQDVLVAAEVAGEVGDHDRRRAAGRRSRRSSCWR